VVWDILREMLAAPVGSPPPPTSLPELQETRKAHIKTIKALKKPDRTFLLFFMILYSQEKTLLVVG
jgi:hypothetical protein